MQKLCIELIIVVSIDWWRARRIDIQRRTVSILSNVIDKAVFVEMHGIKKISTAIIANLQRVGRQLIFEWYHH